MSTQAHATVDRGVFEGEVQKAVHSYLNTTAQMLLGSRFPFMPFAPGSQTGLPAQESSLVSAMGATSMLHPPSGPYFGPPYFHPAFAMGANTHMVPLYPTPQQQQQQQQQQQPPQRLIANSPAAYQGSSSPSSDSWDGDGNR